jgi:hypothetical protein
MTGMDYFKMFADSIDYADVNGKPIDDKIAFIDKELEKTVESDDEIE